MPGGRGNIKPSDGVPFSKDNQPKKKRGKSLTNRMKKLLQTNSKDFDEALLALLEKAKAGDQRALEFFADRTEGKPTVKLEQDIKSNVGGNLLIVSNNQLAESKDILGEEE